MSENERTCLEIVDDLDPARDAGPGQVADGTRP